MHSITVTHLLCHRLAYRLDVYIVITWATVVVCVTIDLICTVF